MADAEAPAAPAPAEEASPAAAPADEGAVATEEAKEREEVQAAEDAEELEELEEDEEAKEAEEVPARPATPPAEDLGLEDSDDEGPGLPPPPRASGDEDLGLDDSEDSDGDSQAGRSARPAVRVKAPAKMRVKPRFTAAALPRLGAAEDEARRVVTLRLPENLLDVQHSAFEEGTFLAEDRTAEMKSMQEGLAGVIRWRYKRDDNGIVQRDVLGNALRESNARVVKFSNGDVFLFVGTEAFPMSLAGGRAKGESQWISQTLTLDEAHTTAIRFLSPVEHEYNVKPTMKGVATRLNDKYGKKSGAKRKRVETLAVSNENYEQQSKARAREEMKRHREAEKRLKQEKMRRERPTYHSSANRWSRNFLEDGASDGEEAYARTSGYQKDDFIASSDDEEVGMEITREDDEEEEDILSDDDEDDDVVVTAPKRRGEGRAVWEEKGGDAEDGGRVIDDDDDDGDAGAAISVARAPPKKANRSIIDDDDEGDSDDG